MSLLSEAYAVIVNWPKRKLLNTEAKIIQPIRLLMPSMIVIFIHQAFQGKMFMHFIRQQLYYLSVKYCHHPLLLSSILVQNTPITPLHVFPNVLECEKPRSTIFWKKLILVFMSINCRRLKISRNSCNIEKNFHKSICLSRTLPTH